MLGRMAHRVANQIDEDLDHAARFTASHQRNVWRVDGNGDATVAGGGLKQPDRFLRNSGEIDPIVLDRPASRPSSG